MVVVFPTAGKLDFVALTSIHYALEQCGGPVVTWSHTNRFENVDKLCIVGRGSPGAIGGKPATEIAQELIERGLGTKLQKLVIASCNAGVKVSGESVIDMLARKFMQVGITGLTLKGANGPSVKAHALAATQQGEFYVVDPKHVQRADDIQRELMQSQDYEFLEDLQVEANDKDLANKALFASEVTFAFFQDFVKALAQENLLLAVPMSLAKS